MSVNSMVTEGFYSYDHRAMMNQQPVQQESDRIRRNLRSVVFRS
jgi:hypothetical protein